MLVLDLLLKNLSVIVSLSLFYTLVSCRLLTAIVQKIRALFISPGDHSIDKASLFCLDLIFSFELHQLSLYSIYYFTSNSDREFSAIALVIAGYYLLAWGSDYCGHQFLVTHFVSLPPNFLSPDSIDATKNSALSLCAFVLVQVFMIGFVFAPISVYLIEKYFVAECKRSELECFLCHHQHENLWLEGKLEFVGAFLTGWVVSKYSGLPLVTISSLFRVLLHSMLNIFGHPLYFIHIIPVTSLSYMAFCHQNVKPSYLFAHWLAPFLGSLFSWLFFHEPAKDPAIVIKTSVSSLAVAQSLRSASLDSSRRSDADYSESEDARRLRVRSKKCESSRGCPCCCGLHPGDRRESVDSICPSTNDIVLGAEPTADSPAYDRLPDSADEWIEFCRTYARARARPCENRVCNFHNNRTARRSTTTDGTNKKTFFFQRLLDEAKMILRFLRGRLQALYRCFVHCIVGRKSKAVRIEKKHEQDISISCHQR